MKRIIAALALLAAAPVLAAETATAPAAAPAAAAPVGDYGAMAAEVQSPGALGRRGAAAEGKFQRDARKKKAKKAAKKAEKAPVAVPAAK